MYATVTSKGQVTLPAALRGRLGILAGAVIGFREEDGQVILETAPSLDQVSARLERITRKNGTWGTQVGAADAWPAAAAERYVNA
jgi:AbrB family looped-hinge helix DNA binding protein